MFYYRISHQCLKHRLLPRGAFLLPVLMLFLLEPLGFQHVRALKENL